MTDCPLFYAGRDETKETHRPGIYPGKKGENRMTKRTNRLSRMLAVTLAVMMILTGMNFGMGGYDPSLG